MLNPTPAAAPVRLHRLAWMVAGLLTLSLVLLALDRLAVRQLAADAEQSAVAWAEHLARDLPELQAVLEGRAPGATLRQRVDLLRGSAGLLGWRLLDAGGHGVLGDAGTRPLPAEVLAGHSLARLESRMTGEGAITTSLAWAPVRRGAQVLGAVELQLDQTRRAALTTASFQLAALTSGAALALLLAGGGWLWRRRSEADRRTQERLHYLARHDTLTGTLNLASFRERLAQACAALPPAADGVPRLAVLQVDLDGFRDLNGLLGHETGDRLLEQAAQRLRGALRSGDALARLGGDRFAVLQGGVAGSDDVAALAQRVLAGIAAPWHDVLPGGTAARTLALTACVGAALHGVDGVDAETLIARAEQALLRAKGKGPHSFSFYDGALDGRQHRRRELAQALREALAGDGLHLHFQPLIGAGGTVVGHEALARWTHAALGPVSPAEFIPLAEQHGLIEALGSRVLHAACREAARWPAPLRVAVNLSAAQFREPGHVTAQVRSALAASGLAARRLELEITESLLMHDTEPVLAELFALHAMGVRIAMDDFGTGFSSLAYLWRFPFDKLKLDRAFTQGLGDDRRVELVLRSVVQMAHALNIRVCAEGVETEAQRRTLLAHGCDELQGFLLGRPQARVVPAEAQAA